APIDGLLHACVVGDVGRHAQQSLFIGAEIGRQLLQRIGVDVDRDDADFLVEEAAADRAPDAAGGTRDHRDAILETSHGLAPDLLFALQAPWARSRSLNFWTLPVEGRSIGPNTNFFGSLNFASRARQNSSISSALTLPSCPSFSSTNTQGLSPQRSSFMATAAA